MPTAAPKMAIIKLSEQNQRDLKQGRCSVALSAAQSQDKSIASSRLLLWVTSDVGDGRFSAALLLDRKSSLLVTADAVSWCRKIYLTVTRTFHAPMSPTSWLIRFRPE